MGAETSHSTYLKALPCDWEIARISDVAKVVGGGTPSRDIAAYWHGVIPWVTPSEVSREESIFLAATREYISSAGLASSGATLLPIGALMITTRATLGARAISAAPMTTNQGFKSLVFADPSDAPFYFYVADKLKPELKRRASGTTFLEVSGSEIADIRVPVPPRAERTQIAQVLDTLDTTIRNTEAIIAKLKLVKQGLLHDLLTRGIDANGELRPPQSEAPHLYKASPLGWIPVEWNVVETAHRCSLITKGTTPVSNQMWQGEEGVRFLRVDNLSFDGQLNFIASNFRISTVTHESELMRSQCLPGDVLTNIVGPPLGKLGLISEESGPININQAIALFRPTSDLLSNFLLTWLGSTLSQVWLRQRAKQTSGQVNLTLALCQELPIPDMTLIEQRAIVERVASSQARIDVEASTLHKLAQLKSGLMDDLLTGRVRVTPLLAQAPATQP
ncbi:restriction endonuclease subunit S [Aquabacterium sp.]|uniref:restriction endonuclease subunit S n=1 Tax=Aquabacterium sp. TaxID=1872578 RepID=UPI0025B8C22E|nr:restriction endonuclease subunit S [Aquabacterium sp.]